MADIDLEAFTERIRAHRRKKALAKLVGVTIGFLGLGPAIALGVMFGSASNDDFSGRIFWLAWAGMCLVGGLVWQKLEPERHIDEIE